MKKLGKLTALWLCWELWDWLAENPNRNKEDWPKWVRNEGNHIAREDCFACEYYLSDPIRTECYDECIIPCFAEHGHCNWGKAPYKMWRVAKTRKTRKKYARIIASSAYKEYKRLGGKKCKTQ